MTARQWSNASVLRLSGGRDPVQAIVQAARDVVLEAIDSGWSGPPYDPIKLAEMRGISISPRADIPDARIVPAGQGRLLIEYNPTRPVGRLRYSIAHELAHTLFPDCAERIRNRGKSVVAGDEWQLEALCNLAAAELLMPIGSIQREQNSELVLDNILKIRKQFEVSTEAVLIRMVHLSEESCAVFVASRIADSPANNRYAYDYLIPSRTWRYELSRGSILPRPSPLAECTAVGYTAKGKMSIPGTSEKLRIECIGIPPYPGAVYPRVAGFIAGGKRVISGARIEFLSGDVLAPRGEGEKLIVHVVSDATPNWGGRGVAVALKKKWPHVQDSFKRWFNQGRRRLGEVHYCEVENGLELATMICQRGYGPSEMPRIRYAALEQALGSVARRAGVTIASIHMPRIGCGQAGGSWVLIEELVNSILIGANLSVTVYDLPNSGVSSGAAQLSLASVL
jgi:O-acetyl-ADP-ribose deacetylase (regulator of RNase III)